MGLPTTPLLEAAATASSSLPSPEDDGKQEGDGSKQRNQKVRSSNDTNDDDDDIDGGGSDHDHGSSLIPLKYLDHYSEEGCSIESDDVHLTNAIRKHHLVHFGYRDIEGIISDYSVAGAAVVDDHHHPVAMLVNIINGKRVQYVGIDEIRQAYVEIFSQHPITDDCAFHLKHIFVHERNAMSVWNAKARGVEFNQNSDNFVFDEYGKIVTHFRNVQIRYVDDWMDNNNKKSHREGEDKENNEKSPKKQQQTTSPSFNVVDTDHQEPPEQQQQQQQQDSCDDGDDENVANVSGDVDSQSHYDHSADSHYDLPGAYRMSGIHYDSDNDETTATTTTVPPRTVTAMEVISNRDIEEQMRRQILEEAIHATSVSIVVGNPDSNNTVQHDADDGNYNDKSSGSGLSNRHHKWYYLPLPNLQEQRKQKATIIFVIMTVILMIVLVYIVLGTR